MFLYLSVWIAETEIFSTCVKSLRAFILQNRYIMGLALANREKIPKLEQSKICTQNVNK